MRDHVCTRVLVHGYADVCRHSPVAWGYILTYCDAVWKGMRVSMSIDTRADTRADMHADMRTGMRASMCIDMCTVYACA